jgi:hypothetical protein
MGAARPRRELPHFAHGKLIMNMLVTTVLAVVVPFCMAAAQRVDPNKLVGRWSGAGTFFNAELRQKVDSVPFVLQIEPDRTGTGHVAGIALRDIAMKQNGRYVEVRARLARPIASDPALDKDRLVLVFTTVSDTAAEAEFHLKTNFVYDLKMREGRVTLARAR